MEKHTKGPWEVEFDDNDPSDGHIIRMGSAIESPGFHKTHHRIEYEHMLYPGDKGFKEAQANARLIAAAPDLLAELQNIANANPRDWDDPGDFQGWAQSRARAMIAKATGAEVPA